VLRKILTLLTENYVHLTVKLLRAETSGGLLCIELLNREIFEELNAYRFLCYSVT
jgi:hypothetical protein